MLIIQEQDRIPQIPRTVCPEYGRQQFITNHTAGETCLQPMRSHARVGKARWG